MSKEYNRMRAEAEAKMEVLKLIVPQVASSPRVLTRDDEGKPAPDSGDIDSFMLTNMNSDICLGLIGLRTIAKADDAQYIDDFVDVVLRALKGINGFTVKQLERIAIGMSSGAGAKIAKRPGWAGRNITNRSWKEKAEEEGAEIES